MSTDREKIAALLQSYEAALNASDTDAVMKLYAPDAVLMPQNSASSIGVEAVRKAYEAIFKSITLKVRFDVAEIKLVAQNWAFARTNSAGTVTLNASGAVSPEANQELFVLQQVDGAWKIARYCFSTTNPRGA